jgi:hypothetical protein
VWIALAKKFGGVLYHHSFQSADASGPLAALTFCVMEMGVEA